MTFAIFALAEAQPHHNARHTMDDGAELTGLAPEVVLPTEEVETTEGVNDFLIIKIQNFPFQSRF